MKLYGFGCSYTKWHWNTWFDYLVEITGLPGVNLAAPGNSNEIIHESVYLQEEVCDPDSLFLIMWTLPYRQSVYVGENNISILANMYKTDADCLEELYCHRLDNLPYLPMGDWLPIDNLYFDSFEGYNRRLNILLSSVVNLLGNRKFLIMHADDHEHKIKSCLEHCRYYNQLRNEKKILKTCFDSVPSYVLDKHPLPLEHLNQAKNIAAHLDLPIDQKRLQDLLIEASTQSHRIKELKDSIIKNHPDDPKLTKGKFHSLMKSIIKKPTIRTVKIALDRNSD